MENTLPTSDSSLENCESVIIGLGARRFAIVRHDETNRLHPVARCGIRELCPGDEVIYQGAEATVQAIEVYR